MFVDKPNLLNKHEKERWGHVFVDAALSLFIELQSISIQF